jgi:hypothetical protein
VPQRCSWDEFLFPAQQGGGGVAPGRGKPKGK